MRKSFLQILGESYPPNLFGMNRHDLIQKEEAFRNMESAQQFIGSEEMKVKAVTGKNKR